MKTYKEAEEPEHSDTEITLGPRSILGIFFGLVLICGVFFGFGYSLGRGNSSRAPEPTAQIPLPSPQTTQPSAIKTVVEPSVPASSSSANTQALSPVGPTPKPAGASLPFKPSAASATQPAPVAPVSTPESDASAAPVTAATSSNTTAQANPVPVAYPAQLPVQTSSPGTAPTMVQIAAVSHNEDADVLVTALKKLGYNASVHAEPTDHLLHVQIGPFVSRDEAMAMRTRLLNDGYNAILK